MPATPLDRTSTDPQQLIAFLNAIRVGALDGIRAKLAEARQRCFDLGQPDLADRLTEAGVQTRALLPEEIGRYVDFAGGPSERATIQY